MTRELFSDFFPKRVLAITTNREIDYSFEEGLQDLSAVQKSALSDQIRIDLPRAANIRQVHGNRVITVSTDYIEEIDTIEEADGLLTNTLKLPLVIRTADCLPVFIYDEKNSTIGLVHAGWKGSQKEITAKTLKIIMKRWDTEPQHLKIAFGPAIRPCCYGVGEEFLQYFPNEVSGDESNYYLDLPAVNKNQLIAQNIPAANIFDCGICTSCNQNYFSYRREGKTVGRLLSLIMLRGD